MPVTRQGRGLSVSDGNGGQHAYLLPEQVWDNQPPSGEPGFASGEGTFSATPLRWSHAQFIRLAWDIQQVSSQTTDSGRLPLCGCP